MNDSLRGLAIGRVVWYSAPGPWEGLKSPSPEQLTLGCSPGIDIVPAIITRVLDRENGIVKLTAFLPDAPPEPIVESLFVPQGNVRGSWRWPERDDR